MPLFRVFAEKVFASRSPETCETVLLREGKPPFYARIEARSTENGQECRAMVVDVTERKRAEEKIQEQTNLLELAHDAIFVRSLDEKIRYWNKGAEHLYGWTAEEAIDGDFEKMVHADRASFEAARKILLEEGSWEGEVRKLTKARREVIVASRWTLLRDDQGNPRSILAIETDITEKRQMEAQFRAQRLEIIGTLAGGIAHDLNNILQVIITNLDLAAHPRRPSMSGCRNTSTTRAKAPSVQPTCPGDCSLSRKAEPRLNNLSMLQKFSPRLSFSLSAGRSSNHALPFSGICIQSLAIRFSLRKSSRMW